MPADNFQEIEVEVVESADVSRPAVENAQSRPPVWQAQMRRLDMRWWPLWVLAGVMGLVLLLTVGVIVGAVLLIVKFIRTLFAAIFYGRPAACFLSI